MQPRATRKSLCDVILAATREREQKIAMIAFHVKAELQRLGLSASPEDFDACIECLAGNKAILTFGNTKRWRFSEACLHDKPLGSLETLCATPADAGTMLMDDWQSLWRDRLLFDD